LHPGLTRAVVFFGARRSLNVHVSASIMVWEYTRQMRRQQQQQQQVAQAGSRCS